MGRQGKMNMESPLSLEQSAAVMSNSSPPNQRWQGWWQRRHVPFTIVNAVGRPISFLRHTAATDISISPWYSPLVVSPAPVGGFHPSMPPQTVIRCRDSINSAPWPLAREAEISSGDRCCRTLHYRLDRSLVINRSQR
jgi:hypothetical protein